MIFHRFQLGGCLVVTFLLLQETSSFVPCYSSSTPPATSSSPTRLLETIVPATHAEKEEEDLSASTLRSLTLWNVNRDDEPEILCDFLLELGACSAAIVDADRGTEWERGLYGEFDAASRDGPWRESGGLAAPIWNRCHVTAQFPASVHLPGVLDTIADCFPDRYPLHDPQVQIVPDRDWVIHVQKDWKPIVVGPFLLRFPWHTQQELQQAIEESGTSHKPEERVELLLQGGVAFGTGEHPTTRLCLEWLHQQISSTDGSLSVLDYGSGSGILGMAACALAPDRVRAVGIDIDVDAVRIANANAVLNRLQDSMHNYLPPLVETADPESKSLLLKAHAQVGTPSSDVNVLPEEANRDIYHLCVANILAGPLCRLASTLAALVRPGGRLAMSGILSPQADAVLAAYSEFFDRLRLERTLGGWVLITGTRKG